MTAKSLRNVAIIVASFDACALASCESPNDVTTTETATIVALSPTQSTGTVGERLVPAPRVRVVDKRGTPLPFERIRFVVGFGGGLIEEADTVTNANGEAQAQWQLGIQPNKANILSVILPDRDTLAFVAYPKPGAADHLTPFGGGSPDQVGFAGEILSSIAVMVQDRFSNSASSGQVLFTVAAGGGQLAGGRDSAYVAVTSYGFALAPGWRLGRPGVNALRAELPGLSNLTLEIFAIDSAHVTRYVSQRTGQPVRSLALSPTGHFIHETWFGSPTPSRYTGTYTIASGRIRLSGCERDFYYDYTFCSEWNGDVGQDIIVLNGSTYVGT